MQMQMKQVFLQLSCQIREKERRKRREGEGREEGRREEAHDGMRGQLMGWWVLRVCKKKKRPTGSTSVFFCSVFLWPANGCSQHLDFFSGRRDGRSGTETFFIGGRRLKNKKMALVLIKFSGVSLHGE
jgi:hypothetical protein